MFAVILKYYADEYKVDRPIFIVLVAALANMNSLMFFYIMYLWEVSICNGTLHKVEPSEIINENILAMFNTATITDCWVKCKKTNNVKQLHWRK